jgi:hypothetical protein
MRHLSFISVAIVSVLAIAGCAQGTSDGLDHADARPGGGFADANPFTPDAPGFPDAGSSFPDAHVNPPPADANLPTPDAAGGGGVPLGGNCNTSSECDATAPCCFVGVCFVDPGIPGACS